jgi:excisionase family DNA binding protein
MESEMLTPQEVAAALRVSVRVVYGLIQAGRLSAVDVGLGNEPRWRITNEAFTQYTKSLEVKTDDRG